MTFDLLSANEARITNVPAYRYRKAVTVDVPGLGPVTGDIAWGGNWFFLTEHATCPVTFDNLAQLSRDAQAMLDALHAQNIGGDGAPVDHIEIFGAPSPGANSRSFVLCPVAPTTVRRAAPAPAPSSPAGRRWQTATGRDMGAGKPSSGAASRPAIRHCPMAACPPPLRAAPISPRTRRDRRCAGSVPLWHQPCHAAAQG